MRLIHHYLQGTKCPQVGAAIVRALGSNTSLINKTRQGAAACAAEIIQYLTKQSKAAAPSAGAAYRSQWLPHYSAMNYARHKLDRYGPHNTPGIIEQRRALAAEILELEKKCLHAWALADYHQATGQPWAPLVVDPPTEARALSELLLKKRRQLARMQTKQRKQPTEARGQQIAALAAELATL